MTIQALKKSPNSQAKPKQEFTRLCFSEVTLDILIPQDWHYTVALNRHASPVYRFWSLT